MDSFYKAPDQESTPQEADSSGVQTTANDHHHQSFEGFMQRLNWVFIFLCHKMGLDYERTETCIL